MKNNKGQVLIMFVMLLPVLLLFLGMIIDMGYNYFEKRKMDNIIKDTISYGFEHIAEEPEILRSKLNNLITKNISNITSNNIVIEDNYIKISLIKTNEGLFSKVLNKKLYEINSSYYGYVENEELKIIKE